MNEERAINRLLLASILVGTTILPHQTLLHGFMPISIAGKNLWLFASLSLALVGLVGVAVRQGGHWHHSNLLVFFAVFCVGVAITLTWAQSGWINAVIGVRVLLLLPLSYLVGSLMSSHERFSCVFLGMLMTQGLFQACFGLLHVFVFPEVITGTYAYWLKVPYFMAVDWPSYTSREAGTLGNPSAYAEMICLGAYAGLLLFRRKKINAGLQLVLLSVSMLAVIPSLSRLGIVFLLLLMLHAVWLGWRHKIDQWRGWVIVPALLFLLVLMLNLYPNFMDRLRVEGMYGRWQKNELAWQVITSGLTFFLYGVPGELLLALRSPEGFGFGDNGYLRLMLTVGAVWATVWFAAVGALFVATNGVRNFFQRRSHLGFLLIGYLLMLNYVGEWFYNDAWVIFAMMLLPMSMISVDDGVRVRSSAVTPQF